jgi:hypothetical protein
MGIDIDMQDIQNLIVELQKKAGDRKKGFVIGNSSDLFTDHFYYRIPLREAEELIYTGVIVRDVETAIKIACIIDGCVDYIFVDAEKKIRKIYYGEKDAGNIEKAIKEKVKKSKIFPYKGNDLAVEALDQLLASIVADLGGLQVAVVGAGNLGSKIALKLVERGAYVRLYRRNSIKLQHITEGLNAVKSEHTLSYISAKNSIHDACLNADIIIACANEKSIIPIEAVSLMNPSGPRILIDAGKGCFEKNVLEKYQIFRLDVSVVQQSTFSSLLKTENMYTKPIGRLRIENGINLVSLGLLGRYGEIIVDDIYHPKKVIGVCDGAGFLLKDVSEFEEALKSLHDKIQNV